jgi:hypothetical protein
VAGWHVANTGAVAGALAEAYGTDLPVVGLLTTALFLTHFAVQVPGGKLIDRAAVVPVLALAEGRSAAAAATLLGGLVTRPLGGWAIRRFPGRAWDIVAASFVLAATGAFGLASGAPLPVLAAASVLRSPGAVASASRSPGCSRWRRCSSPVPTRRRRSWYESGPLV